MSRERIRVPRFDDLKVGKSGEALQETVEAAERLFESANHDDLTGLLNKSALEDHVDRWAHNHPKESFVLVYVDLNDFKKVNDSYGHATGDEVLRKIAAIMTRSFRRDGEAVAIVGTERRGGGERVGEAVARMGGDEFAIFLPVTQSQDWVGASDRATFDQEAVQHYVTETLYATRDELIQAGEASMVLADVGFAVGVAIHQAEEVRPETLDTLLHAADNQMYNHKREQKDDKTPVA